jgi:hypothetical protein
MSNNKRYVVLPVVVHNKKIYPMHKVEFVEDDYFGNSYKIKGDDSYSSQKPELTTATYDVKTHKFVDNISINVYPEIKFNVGETLYYKPFASLDKVLKKDVLKEIVWEDYDIQYVKYGEDTYDYILDALTEEQKSTLRPGNLIEVREWKAKFVFESGYKTRSSYDIFRIVE